MTYLNRVLTESRTLGQDREVITRQTDSPSVQKGEGEQSVGDVASSDCVRKETH